MINNKRCLIVLVHSLSNLTLVEEQIKKLCSQDIIKTLDESAIAKMKEPIIDFLHRLKDKHPSSTHYYLLIFYFIIAQRTSHSMLLTESWTSCVTTIWSQAKHWLRNTDNLKLPRLSIYSLLMKN